MNPMLSYIKGLSLQALHSDWDSELLYLKPLKKQFLTLLSVFFSIYLSFAGGTNATWNGSSNTSWTTNANWSTNVVNDFNATIPTAMPRYPILTANQTLRTLVAMGDGASISGNFSLTPSSNSSVAITGTATISSILAGSSTFTKTGTGVWVLSGANTFSNSMSISAGTLRLGSASALGTTAGSTSINIGAALDLNGINYSTQE
jgi:fibronectin-binding autotransporter adhesin